MQNTPLIQAAALQTVKLPSLKYQIDNLIKTLMAEYGLGFYSAESVDAPWAPHDFDANGRATGYGQWRALRRFAMSVRAI
jgi:hypothetical protein